MAPVIEGGEVIESLGGLVVADLMCTGLVTDPNTIHRDKDPLTDIAAHGLKRTSCPRMIEDFKTRVRTLIEKAEEFSVDGIVIQYINGQDNRVFNSDTARAETTFVPLKQLSMRGVMQIHGKLVGK